MKYKMQAAAILVAFAAVLSAADANGTWKGSFEAPDGSHELTFELKATSAGLSGKVSGLPKAADISDGKVDGNTISFTFMTEYQGNPLKLVMKGTVGDGQIKFSMGTEDGGWGTEFTAKKS